MNTVDCSFHHRPGQKAPEPVKEIEGSFALPPEPAPAQDGVNHGYTEDTEKAKKPSK